MRNGLLSVLALLMASVAIAGKVSTYPQVTGASRVSGDYFLFDDSIEVATKAITFGELLNTPPFVNALAGKCDKTTTINGHALSGNVSISLNSLLPDQSGYIGGCLKTDGTTTYWGLCGGGGGSWGTIVGSLADQADLNAALSNKESQGNKSTLVTLGNSDILYPSQSAVKTYVDTGLSGKLGLHAKADTAGASDTATSATSSTSATKPASGTASQVVVLDGSGNFSSAATLAKIFGGWSQDNSSLNFPTSGTVPAITPSAHGVVISGSGSAAAVTDVGTAGYALTSNGPGLDPTWQANGGAGISQLTSDVVAGPGSGSQAATVAAVGGSTAANVHSAELLANGATPMATGNKIVSRDNSGDFAAHIITASLSGNATTATTATTASAVTALTITDAMVNATAGIALSKLAALGGDKVLISSHTGQISESSISPTTLGYLDATSSIQSQLNATMASAGFTDAAVTGKLITGFTSGSGTVAATDTLLQAINKLDGNTALKFPTASFTDSAVTGKLITGFSSASGTVAATDTLLQAINKLDGNVAGKLGLHAKADTAGAADTATTATTAIIAGNVSGTVAILNGGTGQTTKAPAFDALAPGTTKGDLVVHNGTSNIRFGVCPDGQAPVADSTQASGWSCGVTGGGGGAKNFVANPSGATTANNWTLTNSSGFSGFYRDSTAANGIGGTNYSLAFWSANNLDVVSSDAMTLDNDVTGNCQLSGSFFSPSSTYALTLKNGAAVLQTLPIPANTAYTGATFNYPCASGYKAVINRTADTTAATITGNVSIGSACIASPSSLTGISVGQGILDAAHVPAAYVVGLPGTCSAGQIQMSANASGSGTGDSISFMYPINFGNVSWGKATNLSQVSQASYVGSVKFGTDCYFSLTTNTGWQDLPADATCTTTTDGPVSAAAGVKFGVTLPVSNGNYIFKASKIVKGSSGTPVVYVRFYDGTTASKEAGMLYGFTSTGLPLYAIPTAFSGSFDYTGSATKTVVLQGKQDSGSGESFEQSSSTDSPLIIEVYKYPTANQLVITVDQQSSNNTVEVVAGNGRGSTNTKVRRYSTILTNKGNAVTYADDASNGAFFTINLAGNYTIKINDRGSVSASECAIVLNSAQGTVDPDGVTTANLLAMGQAPTGNVCNTSWTGPLNIGDVIRPQVTSTVDDTNANQSRFRISLTGQANASIPILQNQASTSSEGGIKTEFWVTTSACNTASTCAALSRTPAMTVTRGAGVSSYNAVFAAGTFSAAPSCTGVADNGNEGIFEISGTPTATSFPFVFIARSGGAVTDIANRTAITCTGPR